MERDPAGKPPKPSALPFLPTTPSPSLAELREAAAACRGCDLCEKGTRTVFGEGSAPADVLLLGEQPGDAEDKEGRPFVGPAGRLLDKALLEAGIERGRTYVTNTVKHFKWAARGKRRIHEKPNATEINACRPWLDAELKVVAPKVVVCLGATAAQAMLGRSFRLTQHRGELLSAPGAGQVIATIHPSAILRMPDRETYHAEVARLVADLAKIPPLLRAG